MRPSPIGDHVVANILRIAQRFSTTGSTVGAAATTLRTVPGKIVGAGARMSGRLIPGDAHLDNGISNLRIRYRLTSERRAARHDQERGQEKSWSSNQCGDFSPQR
jgi:hypothetical protein